jgi:hypothetical protein
MSGEATYIIAAQLKHWMEERNATTSDLQRAFGYTHRTLVEKWLAGRPVQAGTIIRLAEYFHTTPNKFYGKNLNLDEGKSCGTKKALAILNAEGGDYLGEDSGGLALTPESRGGVYKKSWSGAHLSDKSDKSAGGY